MYTQCPECLTIYRIPVDALTRAHGRAPRPTPRGSRMLRYANLLLLLGLLAQATYAGRSWWMNEPRLRPWLDAACLRFDCRLPPRTDLGQIALVSRDVRPHPSQAGALIISATMLNRAAFTQPYPIVAPQDYLVDARALARGLAPNATATIDLEVQDPGRNAVAFEFKFR